MPSAGSGHLFEARVVAAERPRVAGVDANTPTHGVPRFGEEKSGKRQEGQISKSK